ncbi:response regulator transcription factor [Dehalobacterium formicoaceticum]|uniref:Stage 0 sporulation protein A homolog n=1 Tax=Dehalobacterium formicoaceticum TaxID=51515 RepID=A0ABT1Y873_9FIRM|nr:response regulator transcription factor [Dehalobacterium formicoaceticum]MCR6546280.1 response regulator transcription factor [Dehalobacterium formicoaceticum]
MIEKNILIADDEPRMRKLVADFLKKEGYQIKEASNGREAVEAVKGKHPIDLVILDVMMPEMDGWTACREIRKRSSVPIVMLTAKSQETDEVFGFELGADEYVTKPFSPNILVARVNAILRRLEKQEESLLKFNGLEINLMGHLVSLDGEEIELSPTEYDLLQYLIKNKGLALSREQILSAVWGYDYYGESRTVDTHITRLRTKLGKESGLIQTVRGLGYRFEANV